MGSALGSALSMTSSTSWNDMVTKIKGVTIGSRSVNQTSTTTTWDAGSGGFTFLTSVTVNATSVYNSGWNDGVYAADNRSEPNSTNYKSGYNSGYSAGWSAGVTAADNRANADSTNYKTGYNNGYSNGYNAGTGNGVPNQSSVQYWSRDNEATQSWTNPSEGWFVIFVYGYVNASGRYETPNLSINGTWKNGHDVDTSTNNRIHAYLYYIPTGGVVSCSWTVHRGTYAWRNGLLIVKVR